MDWKLYIKEFEQQVVEKGVKTGALGKIQMVPVRMGKLAGTRFGSFVGLRVKSDEVFAIDYYGHIKKSEGFLRMVEKIALERKAAVKLHQAPIIHFASIKIEKMMEITQDPFVILGFVEFKKMLLTLRGFM